MQSKYDQSLSYERTIINVQKLDEEINTFVCQREFNFNEFERLLGILKSSDSFYFNPFVLVVARFYGRMYDKQSNPVERAYFTNRVVISIQRVLNTESERYGAIIGAMKSEKDLFDALRFNATAKEVNTFIAQSEFNFNDFERILGILKTLDTYHFNRFLIPVAHFYGRIYDKQSNSVDRAYFSNMVVTITQRAFYTEWERCRAFIEAMESERNEFDARRESSKEGLRRKDMDGVGAPLPEKEFFPHENRDSSYLQVTSQQRLFQPQVSVSSERNVYDARRERSKEGVRRKDMNIKWNRAPLPEAELFPYENGDSSNLQVTSQQGLSQPQVSVSTDDNLPPLPEIEFASAQEEPQSPQIPATIPDHSSHNIHLFFERLEQEYFEWEFTQPVNDEAMQDLSNQLNGF